MSTTMLWECARLAAEDAYGRINKSFIPVERFDNLRLSIYIRLTQPRDRKSSATALIDSSRSFH